MAQILGAFGGLATRGSIANTYTFQNWKGINVVKKKPYPANPQTTAQTNNRDQFTAAIVIWHDARMEPADVAAWNMRASMSGKPQSGFNIFVSRNRIYGLTNNFVLIYNIRRLLLAGQVSIKVTAARTCNLTLRIIRGPNAGYSEQISVTVDIESPFSKIDINPNDICMISTGPLPNIGESGYFAAVLD